MLTAYRAGTGIYRRENRQSSFSVILSSDSADSFVPIVLFSLMLRAYATFAPVFCQSTTNARYSNREPV